MYRINEDLIRTKERQLFYVSMDSMKKAGVEKFYSFGNTFFEYDMENESIKNGTVENYLSSFIGSVDNIIPFEELRERSERKVLEQTYKLLPLLLGLFMITTLAIASMSAINTTKEMKICSVFFICGMKWKSIIFMQMIQVVLICALGCSVAAIIESAVILLGMKNQFLFSLGKTQLLLCVGVCIYMLFISLLTSMHILYKHSPVDIIKGVED